MHHYTKVAVSQYNETITIMREHECENWNPNATNHRIDVNLPVRITSPIFNACCRCSQGQVLQA
jgi:hypothetical protein